RGRAPGGAAAARPGEGCANRAHHAAPSARAGGVGAPSGAGPGALPRLHMGATEPRRRAMDTKQYSFTRTDAEWRKTLTAEQYYIMRQHGTEAPGSCALNYEKRAGTFRCAGCEQPLFVSKQKFESGTGWPSFNDPVPGAVEQTDDHSHGMVRTEVHCSRCG